MNKRIAAAAALSLGLAVPLWSGVETASPPGAHLGYGIARYLSDDPAVHEAGAMAGGMAAAWRGGRLGMVIGGSVFGVVGAVAGAAIGAA